MTQQKLMSLILAVFFIFSSEVAFSQMDRKVKRSVATMIFSSLGGAVLGLSTLPFYGEPQEHANNITVGALLGFIAGAGYVAYDSSRPQAPVYEYSDLEGNLKMKRAPVYSAKAPIVINIAFDF